MSLKNTLIIAEAGENHCGRMDWAEKLIDMSALSGCDYVKFQLYDANQTAKTDPERDWFFRVHLDKSKLEHLQSYSQRKGIQFLCTPWDVDKAKLLHELGNQAIKIASFHITDLEMLRFVSTRFHRVFMSVGMASVAEMDEAVEILAAVPELYLLHCVSEYPLVPERANLRVMDTLRERYGKRAQIGYSDHTLGILAPVAATARGAAVIEKHITLDKKMEGTDHILSADPGELIAMVQQIRATELLLGSAEKRNTSQEDGHKDFLRNRFKH